MLLWQIGREEVMELNRFALHRRAQQALDTLQPAEQQQVLTTLEMFTRIPRTQWPLEEFRKISDTEPLYILRIPPRLRLFIRMENGSQPEVEDIALRDTLATFQSHQG